MKIGNKELVELFGTDTNKQRYEKTRKVVKSMKEDLLNRAENEYKIVKDLGRGRYEIDGKYDGTIIIPNNKMVHPIYGNLIPSIMINIKNYHERGEVFCLSLNSIYSKFDMINNSNYINMCHRRKTSSKVLDINYDILNEFFDVTHDSLKYYLDNSLKFLENLNLIKVIKIPYISLIKSEIIHHGNGVINSDSNYDNRRASKEECQIILDLENNIKDKYKIERKGKLFGKPMVELKEELKKYNIDYYYECYEILSLNNKEIDLIVDFYNKDNLQKLSDEFVNNFINITIANSENRHDNAIIQNLKDFYRFSKDYLDDFMTLSNITLDPKSDSVFIPKFKVDSEESFNGVLEINISKTK